MKVENLHEQFVVQAGYRPSEYTEYTIKEIDRNLGKHFYDKLKNGEGNALLAFPPTITRIEKCNYFGYGDANGEVEITAGNLNYVEIPLPKLSSSAELNTLILNLVFENIQVVEIEDGYYSKCPHHTMPRVMSGCRDADGFPSPSMTVTEVMLKPACSAKGEFLGLVGRCPVCGKIYVSRGGKA